MFHCCLLLAYAGISQKFENSIEDEPFEVIEAEEAFHEDDIFNYKIKNGVKGDNFSSMTSSCHSIESLDNLDEPDISGVSKRCHSIESLDTKEELDIFSQQSSVLEGICADSDDDITVLKRVQHPSESMGEVEELTPDNSEEVLLVSSEEEEDYDIVKPEEVVEPPQEDVMVNDYRLPASKSDGHVHQSQTDQNLSVMDSVAGSLTRSNMSDTKHLLTQDGSENQVSIKPTTNHASRPIRHSPSCPEISDTLRYGFTGKFTPQYTKESHRKFSPLQMFRKLPIVKNPYMSPYLAPDEMLKCLPPIKLVVGRNFCMFP